MRIPLEILSQILQWIDLFSDAVYTLQLRLVSRTLNEEVLKVLMQSDKINPSEIIKLLEIHKVKVPPQKRLHQLVRYRELNGPSCDSRRTRSRLKKTAKPLPQHLIRPYLIARMERAEEDPCLFSVLLSRSTDLVLQHHDNYIDFDRRKSIADIISSFDTKLLDAHAKDVFSTLFESLGLHYWLPHYDAAHLTTQPRLEDNLCLFYIFRFSHNAVHQGSHVASEQPIVTSRSAHDWFTPDKRGKEDAVFNLLCKPPKTPAYARLFAIDCFNLLVNSGSTVMLHSFFVSDTGKLVSTLDLPEHTWCAVKQRKTTLAKAFTARAIAVHYSIVDAPFISLRNALLQIADLLVRTGEETHVGRTVIQEVPGCKNMEDLRALIRGLGLEESEVFKASQCSL